MSELQNIRERLEKVTMIIPRKYAPMIQQILDDCKYLLMKVEENEKQNS